MIKILKGEYVGSQNLYPTVHRLLMVQLEDIPGTKILVPDFAIFVIALGAHKPSILPTLLTVSQS